MNENRGCPMNAFGPCRREECAFFLEEAMAREALTELDPVFSGAPLFMEDRCIILFQWYAAREALGAHGEALRFASDLPDSLASSTHPWRLLFEMLSRLEAKIESLEMRTRES